MTMQIHAEDALTEETLSQVESDLLSSAAIRPTVDKVWDVTG